LEVFIEILIKFPLQSGFPGPLRYLLVVHVVGSHQNWSGRDSSSHIRRITLRPGLSHTLAIVLSPWRATENPISLSQRLGLAGAPRPHFVHHPPGRPVPR